MSTYDFKWDHPATEVYVTGTFDNWAKTEKLQRTGDRFEKTVSLPRTDEKILYKFVVDGHWTHDHTAPQEQDHLGNINNVLTPDHLSTSPLSSAALSSAGGATTAGMAGQQPLEREEHDHIPGEFPQTPANELQSQFFGANRGTSSGNTSREATGPSVKEEEEEEQSFGVNPLPATEGAGNPIKLAPGEKVPDPSTFTSNTLSSNVRDDPSLKSSAKDSEQTFGVAPLPATGGSGNPFKLAPGEKVPEPSSYTSNTLGSNVRLDKESYEKSDSGAPVLPPVLTKEEEDEANGAGMFGVPSLGGTSLIPESSLPMHGSRQAERDLGPTISSAAPNSTTAQLAGQQPLEPRGVPEIVSESQEAAHRDPEAAASPEAVQEKDQVEDELLQKVPEAPSTSESGTFGKSEKGYLGMAAGGLAAAGAAAVGAAYATKDKAAEYSNQAGLTNTSSHPTSADPSLLPTAAQREPEIQEEKALVADEIHHRVPEAPATSESGAFGKSEQGVTGSAVGGLSAAGAAVTGAAYAAKDKAIGNTSTATSGSHPNTYPNTSSDIPIGAQRDPEILEEKTSIADEIHQKVPEAPATSESGTFGKSEQGITGAAVGGLAAAGAAITGAAYAVRDKATGTASTSNTSPSTHQNTHSNTLSEIPDEAQREPEILEEKSLVADEIHERVPEAPATSESGPLGRSEQGVTGKATAGVAAAGAAVAGAAYAAKDRATDAVGASSNERSSHSNVESEIPLEAQREPEILEEKALVGDEIHQRVPEAPATSESGPLGKSEQGITGKAAGGLAAAGAAVTGAAYAARDKATGIAGTSSTAETAPNTLTEIPVEAQRQPEVQEEKAQIADEIHAKVPEAPATSESGALGKSENNNNSLYGAAAGGVAAVGAAAAGGAYLARDKAAEATGSNPHTFLPPSIQNAIDGMNRKVETSSSEFAPYNDDATSYDYSSLPASNAEAANVPSIVTESQQQARYAPEAAASPEAVREKSAVEKELLSEVPTTEASGAPAPTESAALSSSAPVKPTTESTSSPSDVAPVKPTTESTSSPSDAAALGGVGAVGAAGLGAAAASSAKSASTSKPTGIPSGLNAPASAPATTPATSEKGKLAAANPVPSPAVQDSRDVSPMSRGGPTTTTGVATSSTPAKSEAAPAPSVPTGDNFAKGSPFSTPQKARPASQMYKDTPESSHSATAASTASPADKKKKRTSFFGKLKEKFHSK